MQRLLRGLLAQFGDYYKNLTPTKRVSVIGSTVVVMVAAVAVSMMISGKSFVPLIKNISPQQVPVVVEMLRKKNVPFEVGESGTTILVPEPLMYSTQMSLMTEIGTEGIGTIGLELFDKQDLGTTSYVQKVNYQRALQGELMRAINTLSAVRQSKVILALPAKKTFLEEGGTPSASVVVDLQAGKNLSTEQVRGITHLVASAVESMSPDRVTVLDSRGKVLTKHFSEGMSASSELLDLKGKIETQLEDRIESVMAKVVGNGKIIARVNVTLNSKNTTTVEENYDADKTAIRSVTSEEEALDGSRTNPVGVPGARANLPGAQDAGQVGFNQNVRKELKTTNFDVPKVIRNVKEVAGDVERLSVAVLVDGSVKRSKAEDGAEKEEWIPRTPEEIASFDSIVKSTIGFNPARGDSVKVENFRFENEDFTQADQMLTSLERRKLLYSLLKYSILGFSLALFFFLVLRPFMKWVTDSFQDSVEDMLPKTIEELEELQTVDNSLPGMSAALPVLEEALDPDKAESELLKERIMTLMDKDEEKAANAFSLWLSRKET